MSMLVLDKKADLAGPGIGDYLELEKILPKDYRSLLTPKETQQAIFHVKRYIEDNLSKELNLLMVEVPLIVDVESGVNDMLDRDGSRTPIPFHISNDQDKLPIDAQVVQAATNWIFFTPRKSSPCTPTCRASSVKRRSCRSIRPSSLSALAGRGRMATRTRCAPPTSSQGAFGRGQRNGVAENPEGDVREETEFSSWSSQR